MNYTKKDLEMYAKFVRFWSLRMTTSAGSGHPTSSLSATDLMVGLLAGKFRFDFTNPQNYGNDRLIFSKGHASPLYYSLFALAGALDTQEILTYRKFGSNLEGHPTPAFPYTEAATGSLGQGLSIGLGQALALRMKSQHPPYVYVLLGDGEMAEGSVWEAIQLASYYQVSNLVGILDVNRLGQSQQTMLGDKADKFSERVSSFGWKTRVIDGHDFRQIVSAYDQVGKDSKKPYMIIAKTIKGKGVSFIENKDNWHGKPLAAGDFERAVRELEPLDMTVRAKVQKPKSVNTQYSTVNKKIKIGTNYKKEDSIATRKAYGTALAQLGKQAQDIVVLDGDTKNSTYAEIFKAEFPDRYFEMFIAEQNMVGVAVGMSKRGYVPFVSSFAAFLSRGFDQIRMSAVSGANVKFCGSHAGVSIGEDGPSQMGLEDIALFRSIYGSTVFYPSDGVSSEKLTAQMYNTAGICYLRASRPNSPIIYENSEEFPVGGLKIHTLKSQIQNPKSKIIIISAGVTLHEALKAQSILKDDGIEAVVVDLYSLKPVDEKTIIKVSKDTGKVLTVEDHYQAGGIAEIVSFVLRNEANVKLESLFVKNMPKSGKPQELLAYEEIDCHAIVETAKKMLS